MSWVRWRDDFINIDRLTSIEVKETGEGRWVVFYDDMDREVWMIKVDDGIYDEFIEAIQEATKAIRLPIKEGD